MTIVFDNPLAEYADASEHKEHAHVAKLVAEYHEAKAMAMLCRLEGELPILIQRWDDECESLAKQIEEATS